MNEMDKISEIVTSLNQYIEKQEKRVEEENIALLENGRKEFEAAIEERKELFEKSKGNSNNKSNIKQLIKGFSNNLSLKGQRLLGQLQRILRRGSKE
jgi:hypothetical protein